MGDPLTPTLSPGEREKGESAHGLFPLPQGEGQGEGERITPTQRCSLP